MHGQHQTGNGITSFDASSDESPPRAFTTAAPHGRHESAVDRVARPSGYDFLLDSGLSTADLLSAVDLARRWAVPIPDALLAGGGVDDTAYAGFVATALGLPLEPQFEVTRDGPLVRLGPHQVRRLVDRAPEARPRYVVPATAGPLETLHETVRAIMAHGGDVSIAPPAAIAAAIERADRSRAQRHAIHALRRSDPTLSASRPLALWQFLALVSVVGVFVGGVLVMPGHAVAISLVLMLMPFLAVVGVRTVALAMLARRTAPTRTPSALADADLPVYSVFVPLFDESDVVPALVRALAALDYPTAKVDITLVLEEVDLKTKLALLGLPLPHNFRLIVVPDSQPRTKPKALNYAMQFARGDYVVVFDAEDRPEPNQLRKAVAAFRDGPTSLACVQARLNLYNPRDSWLSRQFTIEYSALFDAILPALAWLRLPVPLGGTSNHFPRALLDAIGGWDPFNVTEDADLGIRLARLGYTTEILDSTTWEEAPVTFAQWLPQRTRWLKGWYQTYLVHNRRPRRLLADLGVRQMLGFQVFLGGIILSTLVHPFVYVLLALTLFGHDGVVPPALIEGPALWIASMVTLGVGYGSAIAVGVIAGRRRGHGLAWSALFMPLYWLLVSLAAYRALWQLWRDPFLWEKTKHGKTRAVPS